MSNSRHDDALALQSIAPSFEYNSAISSPDSVGSDDDVLLNSGAFSTQFDSAGSQWVSDGAADGDAATSAFGQLASLAGEGDFVKSDAFGADASPAFSGDPAGSPPALLDPSLDAAPAGDGPTDVADTAYASSAGNSLESNSTNSSSSTTDSSSPQTGQSAFGDQQPSDASLGLAALLQTPGWSKLDTNLAEIALGASGATTNNALAVETTGATLSSANAVTIDATSADGAGATLLQELDAIGLQYGSSFGGDVSGVLPTADVAELTGIVDLAHAYEDGAAVDAAPIPKDASVGMDVADAASKYGATGAGVTVGILSDSFNTLDGADTMQTDIQDGYLPVDTKIIAEDPFSGGEDEGRAMAEIVHEIAPSASILFATAETGDAGFANNILQLAADGAKVIVDDVRYYDEPYYQQGLIAQAINTVEAEGVVYLSSAGNYGENGYQTNFNAGGTFTYGGVSYTAANFSSAGDDLTNSLLPISSSADFYGSDINLQWSQPADSASSAADDSGNGATSNLALFLVNSAGQIVDQLQSVSNDIGGDPIQQIYVNRDLYGAYYLRVGLANGDAAPSNLKISVISDSTFTFGDQDDDQNSGTFYGHAAASGAIGVGAVDFTKTPNEGVTTPISEAYSSSGPDTVYFSPSGAALSSPVDDDVTVSGTDGVQTSFFPTDSGDDLFFGTSAASPSAAAVVADMLQENPTLTPAEIKADLIASAIPTVDAENTANPLVGGAGLVDGDKALILAGSPPPVIEAPPSGSTVTSLDPTLAGFGEAGATIDVFVDGVSSGTTTVAASGVWAYTPATPLLAGGYSVTATQTNASGIASAASGADSFTINPALTAPVIAGTAANQAFDEAQTINPFANIAITDANASQTETVTIAPSTTSNGALSDPNASTDGSTIANGVLTLSGAAGAVISEINQLAFTPSLVNVGFGQSASTGFIISDKDSQGATATDAATSIVVTQGDPDVIAQLPSSGQGPQGGLVEDAKGNLYGVLQDGGPGRDGEIYEIVNQGTAASPVYASAFTDLYDFENQGSAAGIEPSGGLYLDSAGNLLGVVANDDHNGGIFELVNQGNAAAPSFNSSAFQTYGFPNSAGNQTSTPWQGLVADSNGNLYGATLEGGADSYGVLYELANTATAGAPAYASSADEIASLDDGTDYSGLAIDSQNDLFGVLQFAGGSGQAFELPAGAGSASSPAASQTSLGYFSSLSASNPNGGLVVDANGNLFGVAESGGAGGDGVIYELPKNSSYAPTTLYSFTGGTDGSAPVGALTLDAKGDIFGTTTSGGEFGYGAVFELANTGSTSAPTYAATPKTLLNFDVTNGEDPVGGMTFNAAGDLIGVTSAGGPNGDGVIFDVAPCYCRGTRIATARGDVAVEELRIGDLAVTASGGLRPVTWLGHRRLALRRHATPELARPIRVQADAFGAGLPRRDLWLSPGHNIASEGALMPASALVNGRSIAQVDVREVEYWHVELDAHDILLAEGLPAESYLDTGNRPAFANGDAYIEAHPDFAPKHWAETCLPLVQAGPEVKRTRARLIRRLRANGFGTTGDGDAHIVADGQRIEPIIVIPTRLMFILPAPCRDIVLASRRFTPAHVAPESADTRELGLCVARLQIDGVNLGLDRHDLGEGWHEAEREGGRVVRRWTAGAGRLPTGARVICVDLGAVGRYWRERAAGRFTLMA